MKKYLIFISLTLIITFTLTCLPVFADDNANNTINSGIEDTQSTAKLLEWDANQILYAVINGALGVLGVLFISLIIYGGFNYMFSAGEPDKAKNARKIIQYAIIGLIIVIFAYLIWSFVASSLGLGSDIIGFE